MAQITPYALPYYVKECAEVRDLSSARGICLAFNVSQPMNLLKHFHKVSVS